MNNSYMELDINNPNIKPRPVLVIEVNNKRLYASLEDNPTSEDFINKLASNSIEIPMSDFKEFEKVGELPFAVVMNGDSYLYVKAGDVVIHEGKTIIISYDTNRWQFSKIASIDVKSGKEILDVFGEKDSIVKFYLEWQE